MSNAIIGYDTLYEIHDGADPGVFQAIAEVFAVTPPNEQAEEVDVTHFKSPNRTREFISGLIEPGEASFEINWIPADATADIILALKASGAVRQHRITWPNGTTWTFSGFIKGFEPSSPIGDRLTATVTIKVSSSTTEA